MVQILLFIIAFLSIIIYFIVKHMRSARLMKIAQRFEEEGKYLEAVDLYSRVGLDSAVRMTIEAPRATQILVLRRLETNFEKSRINQSLKRHALRYERENDYVRAATSLVLAGKSFDAARIYVDAGISYLPAAIRIADQDPRIAQKKEQFVRNLARYAFDKDHFTEAAELLRLIGANDEAQSILIAAVSRLRKKGKSQEADLLAATSEKTTHAAKMYLQMTKENIRNGNFTEAKRWLASAQQVLNGTISEQVPHQVRNELQKVDQILGMIDNARDFLRKDAIGKAQALYDELVELHGEIIPASVFAEAALANESSEPSEASKLYNIAAQKTKKQDLKKKYQEKARELEFLARTGQPLTRTMIEEVAPDEFCSVCHMAIQTSDEYTRCTKCGSPAHFSHLAEWLKIRGTCPVCRERIHLQQKEKAIS